MKKDKVEKHTAAVTSLVAAGFDVCHGPHRIYGNEKSGYTILHFNAKADVGSEEKFDNITEAINSFLGLKEDVDAESAK